MRFHTGRPASSNEAVKRVQSGALRTRVAPSQRVMRVQSGALRTSVAPSTRFSRGRLEPAVQKRLHPWQKRADRAPIPRISFAEVRDEVALLKRDRDEDVGREHA